MIEWTFIIKTTIALIAIVDPIGCLPLFLSLTGQYKKINKKGVFAQPTVQYSPGGSVQDSFFQFSNKLCPQSGQKMLKINLDIWNQKKVVSLSGYSIEMLIDCLSDLSNFIRVNLSPDRLEGFDLEFKDDY